MRLGKQITIEHEKTIGIRYLDGGFGISDVTEEGRKLRAIGIYYVCEHGRACGNRQRRYHWCPECDEAMERSGATIEDAVTEKVKVREMPFVYSAHNGNHHGGGASLQ